MPEDWATMLQGIFDWIRAELLTDWTAMLAKQDAPSPTKPHVRLDILVPPVPADRGDSGDGLRLPGDFVDVVNVLDAQLYRIVVDAQNADFTSGVGATKQTITTGLIAAVAALGGGITAAQVSTAVQILGAVTVDADTDPNLALKSIAVTEGEGVATVSLDCIGRDKGRTEAGQQPASFAESVAQSVQLQHSLRTSTVQQLLRESGWAFLTIEGVRKPDGVFGGRWEDRSGFDVRLRCRLRALKVVDFIDDAPIDSSIVGTLTV